MVFNKACHCVYSKNKLENKNVKLNCIYYSAPRTYSFTVYFDALFSLHIQNASIIYIDIMIMMYTVNHRYFVAYATCVGEQIKLERLNSHLLSEFFFWRNTFRVMTIITSLHYHWIFSYLHACVFDLLKNIELNNPILINGSC
jgi:hypothetical protein